MGTQTKLAPPIVDSKIPAQVANKQYQSITIPFLMNRAVGLGQICGVKLLIKTVQSSIEVAVDSNVNISILDRRDFCPANNLIFRDGKYWATFQIEDALVIGQTYKVQLAYIALSESGVPGSVGYYSNVGTFKFTSRPYIYIKDLNSNLNIHNYDYIGVYENEDQSERVYSYRFDFYNDKGELIITSGEQLHNSLQDTSVTNTIDKWSMSYSLDSEINYKVVYKVTTINNLVCESEAYRIYNGPTFDSNLIKYCNFIASLNFDEGYIQLSIQPNKNNLNTKIINGKFILLRASSEDNYNTWSELTRFCLSNYDVSTTLDICKDYCIAQGVTYKYAIQAYSDNGFYTNKQFSKPTEIFVDFEDMFLSDGERQLKIRFNPKINSFKTTLQEAKTDTLGGKYPFFYRNGNLSYKEFSISGLISVLMDDNRSFRDGISTNLNTSLIKNSSTEDFNVNLTGYNIYAERDFKIQVLDWLNNGKPKLFRSPTEGNYIVRLMNTSLSPNDTLGRMLHTFNTTAYEIADCNFESLRSNNMMVSENIDITSLRFKTIKLGQDDTYNGKALGLNAVSATIITQPNTVFYYLLKNDNDWNRLEVGPSGMFVFNSELLENNELISIVPPFGSPVQTKEYWDPEKTILIYASYEEPVFKNASTYIQSIELQDRIRRIIGTESNKFIFNQVSDKDNIISSVKNISWLRVSARPIIPIDAVESIGSGKYKFYCKGTEHYPTPEELLLLEKSDNTIEYYDGNTLTLINNIDFSFGLNSDLNRIDLFGTVTDRSSELKKALGLKQDLRSTDGRIILTNLQNIDSLYLGQGVYVDIVYQELIKTYSVESLKGHPVQVAKEKWITNGYRQIDYINYYNELKEWYDSVQKDGMIDVI